MTHKNRPALGRPTIPAEEKRDQIVQFRCTAGERAEIEQAAEKSERRLSDWLRDLALRAARRVK